MAIIQNPVIGRAKNLAGGMVFTTFNGKNVMKAKAFAYRDKKTPYQVQNRIAFTSASTILQGIRPSFDLLKSYEGALSSPFRQGINTSSSIKKSFAVTDNACTWAGSALVFGNGSRQKCTLTAVPDPNGHAMTVDFATTVDPTNSAGTDKLRIILINTTTMESVVIASIATRLAGSASFNSPASWNAADEIQVLAGFVSADLSQGSVMSADGFPTVNDLN